MKRKPQLPLFAAIGSLVLSGVVLTLTFMYVRYLAQQRFDSEVAKVRQSFIEKTTASELLVINLQNFAQIDPQLSKDAFQSILEGIMLNYNFVRSSNLYRIVPNELRKEHEEWLAENSDSQGLLDSSFDDPDTTIPAAPRPYYLSLVYADQRSADNTVFGWNVLSDARRQQAVEKARDSAKGSASDGFLLDDGHAAIEVFVPFYKGGKIPADVESRRSQLAGIIGMTIDLPNLLGDEEWRKNVTVMLSTSLAGSDRLRDLYRSLDKEPEGLLRLGSLKSEVELSSFGQGLKLQFLKDLYFSRLNYGIILLIGLGCVIVSILAMHLARTLVRLAQSLRDLAALNSGLEQKVAERTRDLAHTNAEIQEILDNLDDGILVVDRQLHIEPRFSPATPRILGLKDLGGKSLKDMLFSTLDAHIEEVAKHNFTLSMLFGADDFQWTISHDNLLSGMSYNRPGGVVDEDIRQFSLRYAPLYDEKGTIQRILLVISDVTEVQALRRRVEEAKAQSDHRMQLVTEILQADRLSLQAFMNEAEVRSKALKDSMKNLRPNYPLAILQSIFREVHTFKGNARMVKLQTLSKEAHSLEDKHVDAALKGLVTQETQGESLLESLNGLMALVERYQTTWQELFGSRNGQDQSADLRREWLEVLRVGISPQTLIRLLEGQNKQEIFSFAEIWQSFQNMVDEISGHLGKQVKPLQINGNVFFKLPLKAPLKDALTHLIRNALDHGLETPEQRVEAGKSNQAEIRAMLSHKGESIHLEVQDDGRGVDCEKVWELAQARGVVAKGSPRPSDAEVMEVLFHPGFSTKSEASDISGRGVGLDAVRSFLSEYNCRVEIASQNGKGTSFRLVIPASWVVILWNDSGLIWDAHEARVAKAS